MNHDEGVEYLKLHFGTLFLETYRMPKFQDVINIIDNGVVIFTKFFPYASVGDILRQLIDEVLERSDDLVTFSKNNFLLKFSDRLDTFHSATAPTNLVSSPLMFFSIFFNRFYTPFNKEQIDLIVEWALFAVQFAESNPERTQKALKLLKELRTHLYAEKMKAMLDPHLDNIDAPSLKNKNDKKKNLSVIVSQKDEPILFDTDTKPCDCYEYEQSGDCFCLD